MGRACASIIKDGEKQGLKNNIDDTRIEKTRCGSCQHLFDETCPHGNRRQTYVPHWFAEKCNAHKPMPITLFECSDYKEESP